tara:strand:- start:1912 stop:2088 length:177 start_codon:yes stop_codon:yes gene_type:complete
MASSVHPSGFNDDLGGSVSNLVRPATPTIPQKKKRTVMDELLVHESHHHAHHKYVLRK